jgi:hypothetical protein
LVKKVDFVTRRQDQEEEEEEEEDTHLNPLLSARKRQIFLTQGNLASMLSADLFRHKYDVLLNEFM